MGFIKGDGRDQGTLFPVVLDDLIPQDHLCRVIDAFVVRLNMDELGFQRADAAETGRPGYDPRDLLKLYLYGYLNQLRSSRRLEAECRRNIELMWLIHRLYPDHKIIAEFRRMHREAVTAAGAELVQFARTVGLIRGEWIAIDGTKLRAVSSASSIRDREELQRYLDRMETADNEQNVDVDSAAVPAALDKLRQHPEPEARVMRTSAGKVPAYNIQTAVDAEHALIVTHQVTTAANDSACLQPVAEAAFEALGRPSVPVNIVADCGYSNGAQAAICEAAGLIPHIPAKRGTNNYAGRTLMDRTMFTYQPETDSFVCPAGQRLERKRIHKRDQSVHYQSRAADCKNCSLKPQCTLAPQRVVTGSQTEMSIAVMAYNLKRMANVLGFEQLKAQLATQ